MIAPLQQLKHLANDHLKTFELNVFQTLTLLSIDLIAYSYSRDQNHAWPNGVYTLIC